MPALLAIGLAAGLILSAHPTAAGAAEAAAAPKLRFYDSLRVLRETDEGKAQMARLEREIQEQEQALGKRREAMQKKAEEFDKQSSMMKAEAKEARQRELQQEFDELQKVFMETRERLAKDQSEVAEKIERKVQTVIGKIADRQGYFSVQDKNHGIAYHRPSADITDDIIAAYNRQFGTK